MKNYNYQEFLSIRKKAIYKEIEKNNQKKKVWPTLECNFNYEIKKLYKELKVINKQIA